MTFRARIRWVVLVSALAVAVTVARAQQPAAPAGATSAQNIALTLPVPVDPLITVGRLPNGLRYYIRANKQPQARAELRLVVDAGSVLEDNDQRGLAHFVEHMSFSGTTHFPGQQIGNFMQSLGMRFGAHVNANTSFDETVYELQIPTDNPAVIDRSMLILEDWAHNVSFDSAEIDRERGVVLEEWRLGLGGAERIQNALFPLLLKGSRYAERMPIGRPEIIQNVNHDRLKQFYLDWYRPDLMAVVAVGDFDKAAIEALIKSHFASIPAALAPRPRLASPVPDQPGTQYAVLTDPEATTTNITVFRKTPAREQATVGAYRQQMVEQLFGGMLSARLDEIAQAPGAPFLGAESNHRLFVRAEEASTLDALVAPGGVERGLAALFTEIDRVARFGFTATELNRVRLQLQQGLQRAAVEKDNSPSDPLADEFIRNFGQGEPIPGIVYEYALNQRFLPQITLAEINALAKTWMADNNRLVLVTASEKDKATLPTEARLAAVIRAASSGTLTPYVDAVTTQPLLAALPAPGAVATTTVKPDLGITEWQLANGVHVVLKPTTFKADEILFRAASAGGASLASDQDIVPAQTASMVIGQGGLGNFRALDLAKILAGKSVSVRADIGDNEVAVGGGASRADLETMFQLIYLNFTAPRADPVAFRVLTEQLKVTLANRGVLPDTVFQEAVEAALSQNHPRALPMTVARVDQMNLDKSLAFYKDRFADASGFTFVFVGSFDLATIKPLVERYLGSLPSLGRNEKAKDVGIHPPAGIVRNTVKKGIEPKSQVSIVFTGAFQNDEMHRLVMTTMAETLSGDLFRTLRQDLGGTYGVSVDPQFAKRPNEEYRVTINFTCDPARTENLLNTTFLLIDRFKAAGPDRSQIANAQTTLTREIETNIQQNSYLVSRLLYKYEYGEDVKEVFNMRSFYDQLSAPLLRDAARVYLDTNHYVQVTMVPETK